MIYRFAHRNRLASERHGRQRTVPCPSKPVDFGGLRVRDWLAGQSFDDQTEFGLKKLEELVGDVWPLRHLKCVWIEF